MEGVPQEQKYLFGPGYNSTAVGYAKQLQWLRDYGSVRSNISHDEALITRITNYLSSICSACEHFQAYLRDADIILSQWVLRATGWSFLEAHQLLNALKWHVAGPFAQTISIIKETIINELKSPDANGNQRFRNLLVDPKFVGLYEETKRATTSLDDEIDDRAFLVASHGYTKLRIPDNKAEPYLVPLANPLELFAEILRRSSASKLYEGLVASDLLDFINRAPGSKLGIEQLDTPQLPPYISELQSIGTNRTVSSARITSGRPRVMTWTLGTEKSSKDETVIRSTRPAWERFPPMHDVPAAMRWERIAPLQTFIASSIEKHRRANLASVEQGSSGFDLEEAEKLKRDRSDTLWDWTVHHSEDAFQVQDILAGSFNAYNFRWVSRCWACRALAPFRVHPQDLDTLEAWTGMDPDKSQITSGKDSWTGLIEFKVEDPKKIPSCAEIAAAAEN